MSDEVGCQQQVPLALYVHIPWCVRKCPYCDFNSHEGVPQGPQYLQALTHELRRNRQRINNRPLQSIYFGGGTPNIFPPDWYHQLLTQIRTEYQLASNCEITLESNPGSGRIHDFLGYSQAGITRLSLGVQSFNDAMLTHIGRDYNSQQLHDSLQKAHNSPISNINIDLIFALPQQSEQQALDDLSQALGYQPQHLSLYELTIEPNTSFYSKPPQGLPKDDDKADTYASIQRIAQDNGYGQYEVSAFALAGKESRHNHNYWQFGDYLGIGAGAHSKITQDNPWTIKRYSNIKRPAQYMQAENPIVNQHTLDQDTIFTEWCLNTFRLIQGVSLSTSYRNTGIDKQAFHKYLEPLRDYLIYDHGTVRLTEHAYLHQNLLLQRVLAS